jgi:hypothetical protein
VDRRVAELSDTPVSGERTLPGRCVLLRVRDPEDDLAGLVGCAREHRLRLARLGKREDGAHTGFDSARVKQGCERLQARGSPLGVEEDGPAGEPQG